MITYSIFGVPLELEYPSPVKMQSGGETDIEVKFKVPEGTVFFFSGDDKLLSHFEYKGEGVQLFSVEMVNPIQENAGTFVKGKAILRLKFFELYGKRPGNYFSGNLLFYARSCKTTTFACEEPEKYIENLKFEIYKEKKLYKNNPRLNSNINWMNKKSEILLTARTEKKNIVAVIMAPEWSNASRYLETQVFIKKEIQNVMNQSFVSWSVGEEDRKNLLEDGFAIPTILILGLEGEIKEKISGARDPVSFKEILMKHIYKDHEAGLKEKKD
jgi:hypothetical protein